MRRTIAIICLVFLTSFNNNLAEKDSLFKTWVLTKVEAGKCFTRNYKDTVAFGKHMGITFLKNGKLIAQVPKSWCPVGETEFRCKTVKGTWTKESDSILILDYESTYPSAEKVRISCLTQNQLILKRVFCK